ncbi:MAG: hypothetical protein ING26_06075 [Roseomonas sp.]|nr:hypothetical protein [Roseomonas sp.]MCA3297250.1 hypothetical protein [Roseomonas sp.]
MPTRNAVTDGESATESAATRQVLRRSRQFLPDATPESLARALLIPISTGALPGFLVGANALRAGGMMPE